MAQMTNEELDGIAQAPSDEHEMTEVLRDMFEMLGFAQTDEESGEVRTDDFQDQLTAFVGCKVRTFREAGLMTGNQGIVLTTRDGVEFQIQVVS
jgi:hypothetical protein